MIAINIIFAVKTKNELTRDAATGAQPIASDVKLLHL